MAVAVEGNAQDFGILKRSLELGYRELVNFPSCEMGRQVKSFPHVGVSIWSPASDTWLLPLQHLSIWLSRLALQFLSNHFPLQESRKL